ncbi:MAG: zinc dependent phospholipase C family protein [Defluviitaleaceae bacterium]|nr:zinc dependent phospholipase C family protein [Defluviitaleaceae bacterium]
MPGFLSHYIAGKAALAEVSPEIREIVVGYERLYNLGTQGPDIFFYYLPGQLRKRSRGIAQEMHASGTGYFLAQMARIAKDEPEARDAIFSYIAGFAMHYTLDCHAHPYVYARAFDENAPRIKNSAMHRRFETAIDVEMLKLIDGERPAGVKQWELINAGRDGICMAAEAFSRSIFGVYKRVVPPGVVRSAMRHMIYLTRLLQSERGRRKRVTEAVERVTIREPLYSGMMHPQETGGEDFLNIEKADWRAPWSDEIFNDSFPDRHNAAVREGAEMLTALHGFIYGDFRAEDLAKILGNRSLKTGEEALPLFTPSAHARHEAGLGLHGEEPCA